MVLQRIKWILVCFLLCFLAFVFGRKYLVIDESPKPSDVIIVLSGDEGRLEKAADLYHQGYAKKVLLSKVDGDGMRLTDAYRLGIPDDAIIRENEATSTYTNALYTKKLVLDAGFKSAIVVSSDYHMRRSKLIFDRVYKDSGVSFTYVASKRNETPWYLDRMNLLATATEYIKLPGYYFYLYKFFD